MDMNTKMSEKIIHWIEQEIIKYPDLKITYTYNKNDNTHYIYFSPEEVYFEGSFGDDADEFETELENKLDGEHVVFLSLNHFNPKWNEQLLYEGSRDELISKTIIEVVTIIPDLLKKHLTSNLTSHSVFLDKSYLFTQTQSDIRYSNSEIPVFVTSYAS